MYRLIKIRITLVAAILLGAASLPASAVILDFNTAVSFPHTEDGFMATAVGTPNFGGCTPPCANNGTTNIFIRSPGEGITITPTGPGTFSLVSFEAGELYMNDMVTWTQNIQVAGLLAGGGSVIANFSLDFIHDGPGGSVDIEVFTLPSTFTGLTEVSFLTTAGGGFTLDTVNVRMNLSSIPEPATGALLGLGLFGLGFQRQRGIRKVRR